MGSYSTQGYFYDSSDSGNVARTDVMLAVNCCGIAKLFPSVRINPTVRKDHYLIYMIQGELDAQIGEKKFLMRSGDAICIPPETVYHYACVSNESVKYFWIHFTGSDVFNTMRFSGFEHLKCYEVGSVHVNAELYEELFGEFRSRHQYLEYRASLILRNILLRLAASQNEQSEAKSSIDSSLRYIHTHLSSALNVKMLAEMEYLSQGYYRTVFKDLTGMSPSEYVAEQRIIRAKEMLTDTSVSIDKIAESIGINDRLYFQRFFKKHTGITPSRYRENNKNISIKE
jgi:AraC-like DNA-binding protein/mannose-6-phosphate isomerase-like protein (cupin superfamily)